MDSTILVTGPSKTFVYLKLRIEQGVGWQFTQDHSQINNMEEGRNISTNYTCHAWCDNTSQILVCTANGEMIVCKSNGEYLHYINEAPLGGVPIDSVQAIANGFLVCSQSKLYIFRYDGQDERTPYKLDNRVF